MTEQNANPKPVDTHRDGRLAVAIWANEGEHGRMYNTTLTYSYQDKEEKWRDTHSIPDHQLLKASRLNEMAYATVQRLKERDRAQYVEREQRETQSRPGPDHARER